MAGEVNQNGKGNLVTLIEVDMSNYVHFWAYRCTTPLLRGENSTAKALLYQEHFPAYGFPDWLVHSLDRYRSRDVHVSCCYFLVQASYWKL